MKILSSFTLPQVDPNLYECVCSEHKGRYSEEWGKQSSFFLLLWKSMVPQNSLITNFLQNIFLCVQNNTFIQVWNYLRLSKCWQNFHFWVNCPFKTHTEGALWVCGHLVDEEVEAAAVYGRRGAWRPPPGGSAAAVEWRAPRTLQTLQTLSPRNALRLSRSPRRRSSPPLRRSAPETADACGGPRVPRGPRSRRGARTKQRGTAASRAPSAGRSAARRSACLYWRRRGWWEGCRACSPPEPPPAAARRGTGAPWSSPPEHNNTQLTRVMLNTNIFRCVNTSVGHVTLKK